MLQLIKPVFIPSVFLRIDKNRKTGVLRLIAFCHAPRLKHLTRTTTEKALSDLFSLGHTYVLDDEKILAGIRKKLGF